MAFKLYIASKTRHAAQWRALRRNGVSVISTWIDEAGVGETACFKDLWMRCVREASSADITLIYKEEGETLKGAFIEAGAALASGKPVFAVGCAEFSFVNHEMVTQFDDLSAAIEAILVAQLFTDSIKSAPTIEAPAVPQIKSASEMLSTAMIADPAIARASVLVASELRAYHDEQHSIRAAADPNCITCVGRGTKYDSTRLQMVRCLDCLPANAFLASAQAIQPVPGCL